MKNLKKMLALLLCFCMLFTLLAACGSSSSSSSSSDEEETTEEETTVEEEEEEEEAAEEVEEEAEEEAEAEEVEAEEAAEAEEAEAEEAAETEEAEEEETSSGHKSISDVAPDIEMELPLTTEDVTFTYFTTLNPQILGYMDDLSENLYYMTAEELTGVTIDFQLANPDTQETNFQLMIASGDYTDLIGSEGANYVGGVEAAVEAEIYVNILDYEEYAPHYFDLVQRDEYDYSTLLTDSGYMAGFGIVYTEDQPLNQGYMVRQDWLDELGLDTPTTYDELHDVLVAFQTSYESADTPMALGGNSLSGLSAGFGVMGEVDSSGPPLYVVDGEVTFAWTQDGYKEYLTLMHEWYEEGLLDPDELLVTDPWPTEDKVLTDELGVWKVERDNMSYYASLAQDPDFRCVAIQYPTQEEGETTHFKEITANIASPGLFITTACEDIPLLVQWVDFRYSEEGAMLANYGTEGYTYELDEDGKPAFTEVITDNEEGMTVSLAMNVYTLWRCECLYDSYRLDSTFTQDQREAPDIWSTNSDSEYTLPSVTLTAEEGEDVSALYSDIYTLGAEYITKFITGDKDLSEYDAFVEQIESMGVDEIVAIYQDAYDRYMAR